MSFSGYKTIVEEGDRAIVFLTMNSIYAIKMQKDGVFQTKFGALKHNDVLGRRWGSLVNCSKGWAYILHPTPELWTLSLPHRTQILYTPDISLVTVQLEIRPGSVVIEAGTGSGSLSHALARTILPNGHLFTFDFHEGRADLARVEFNEHGLSDVVTAGHRDVIADGFGSELDGKADAVFLDLPLPWNVISAAKRAIKTQGGRICSFSPCIEQVQKTCLALSQFGFTEISTQECIQRPLDVRLSAMPELLLSPSTPAVHVPEPKTSQNAKRGKFQHLEEPLQRTDPTTECKSEAGSEQIELCDGDKDKGLDQTQDNMSTEEGKSDQRAPLQFQGRYQKKFFTTGPSISFLSAVPQKQTVGHTGFLTFATLYSKM